MKSVTYKRIGARFYDEVEMDALEKSRRVGLREEFRIDAIVSVILAVVVLVVFLACAFMLPAPSDDWIIIVTPVVGE